MLFLRRRHHAHIHARECVHKHTHASQNMHCIIAWKICLLLYVYMSCDICAFWEQNTKLFPLAPTEAWKPCVNTDVKPNPSCTMKPTCLRLHERLCKRHITVDSRQHVTVRTRLSYVLYLICRWRPTTSAGVLSRSSQSNNSLQNTNCILNKRKSFPFAYTL